MGATPRAQARTRGVRATVASLAYAARVRVASAGKSCSTNAQAGASAASRFWYKPNRFVVQRERESTEFRMVVVSVALSRG